MELKRTLKEMARHVLHLAGAKRAHSHLVAADRTSRFTDIYSTGVWKRGDSTIPGSGEGSTLDATARLRQILPMELAKLGTQTLLDIGCGDLTWMKSIDLPCAYIGVDLVPSLIEQHAAEHASDRMHFLVADAVSDVLPEADTVLCREVLFHLSLADARAALANIVATPRRYVILTTDRSTGFNADIESGDFRPLNLEKRPFSLPKPIVEISDGFINRSRVLGIWTSEQIASSTK